jgi:hypothetical protein
MKVLSRTIVIFSSFFLGESTKDDLKTYTTPTLRATPPVIRDIPPGALELQGDDIIYYFIQPV